MNRKMTRIWIYAGISVVGLMSCKSSYVPPAVSAPASYLVAEGIITTGNTDSTIISLSHTVNLSDSITLAAETNAQVTVQDEAGRSYPLSYTNNGKYASPALHLPESGKYRLQIKRSNGATYASDYVEAKTSPPIDSVNYQALDDGLHIFVNAHDNNAKTRYYRWDYQENWEFHVQYPSTYLVTQFNDIRSRAQSEFVYFCYQQQRSSTINLKSTNSLSQDRVAQFPLTTVPGSSEKLSYIYSILVKQYALTEEGFDFYQNLQKNNQQLGSIFSPQPSQLTGNIHNLTNAAEPAIGYISAGAVSSKRIYVDLRRVVKYYSHINDGCKIDTLFISNPKTGRNDVAENILTGLRVPLEAIYRPAGLYPIAYTGSTPSCSDCTTRGSKIKPSFWPY